MEASLFNEKEIRQIKARGMTQEEVLAQIETFKRGISYLKLRRPCTVGDGITALRKSDFKRLTDHYAGAVSSGRTLKFVPASGAASRMFKLLISINNRFANIDKKLISTLAAEDRPGYEPLFQFLERIKQFAFYDDLKAMMLKDGLIIEDVLSKGQYKEILEYVLTPRGLNYPNLPKGMIRFHYYPDYPRTPFEEHLVEAAAYTRDRDRCCSIHFTISPEYENAVKAHLKEAVARNSADNVVFEIGLSLQEPSTDTIAVDPDNRPFRDQDNRLLFRPGGHGTLLKNLNNIRGDIVFVKNIDNVVPDRLKHETYLYKRVLGGYLVELQKEIFRCLEVLATKKVDNQFIKRTFEFVRSTLSVIPPSGVEQASRDEKIDFLFARLNRPLRVCGMVKNQGEPGGGPFWVEHDDWAASVQIVESAQIDQKSIQQRSYWESSTHFNPVDLVCGVRDYQGRPFDLMGFVDPDTGLISIKSKDGKELKALESPGLWNGAMAHWNTVFVEVPVITFNPVKTIIDLLRDEHQPLS